MHVLRYCLLGLLLCLAGAAGALAAECHPAPLEDDFVLSGPDGTCFVFRAVGIGEGGTPYVQKRFIMGDQEEGYKGYPTAVTVGGSFVRLKDEDADDMTGSWFYYLGKYEITQGQYYAIMGLPEGADKALLQSGFPVTELSYFDAMNFINRLNLWLYANAADKLPTRGKSPAFVRLPTEAEWEFAARGGLAARAEQFGDVYPYEDNLAAYEWFFGPSSSHGKIQEVGKLKPNPLGLHDMLGNVSEMCLTPYQLEYYQGSTGGVTTRGGNFTTNEDRMRASLRVEQPLYNKDPKKGMRPSASKTTGFRIALGATVLSDRETINALQDGWDEYLASGGTALPAQLSTAPVEERAGVSIDDAKASLQTIRAQAGKAGLPSSVLQELNKVEALIDTVTGMRRQADEKVAGAFVRLACHQAYVTAIEIKKLNVVENLLKDTADDDPKQARYKALREERIKNINENMDAYLSSMDVLADYGESAEAKGVEQERARLKSQDIPGQLWILDVFQRHSAGFRKDKRADPAGWRKSFSELPDDLIKRKGGGQ